MNFKTILPIGIGIALAILILVNQTNGEPNRTSLPEAMFGNDSLRKATFNILDTKCNVCHRKQNPFMVFKEKNMIKRASKIYRMVFIERRMPKGSEIRLTGEEYAILEKWLLTQELN